MVFLGGGQVWHLRVPKLSTGVSSSKVDKMDTTRQANQILYD